MCACNYHFAVRSFVASPSLRTERENSKFGQFLTTFRATSMRMLVSPSVLQFWKLSRRAELSWRVKPSRETLELTSRWFNLFRACYQPNGTATSLDTAFLSLFVLFTRPRLAQTRPWLPRRLLSPTEDTSSSAKPAHRRRLLNYTPTQFPIRIETKITLQSNFTLPRRRRNPLNAPPLP